MSKPRLKFLKLIYIEPYLLLKFTKSVKHDSSVDWVARVTLHFRFREGASGLLFGATSGQKGGVFGLFLGGFRHPVAPQVVGRRQHLMGNPQISILIRS